MNNIDLGIDWSLIGSHLVQMLVAYFLALPIGWDREHDTPSAGLRTFPLVSVAACGFMLIAIDVLDSSEAQARVMQGIVTGIGFIGGGAILKGNKFVIGTATAASLWATGAIGMAVAWNRYEIAILLSLLTFLSLWMTTRLKKHMNNNNKPRL